MGGYTISEGGEGDCVPPSPAAGNQQAKLELVAETGIFVKNRDFVDILPQN